MGILKFYTAKAGLHPFRFFWWLVHEVLHSPRLLVQPVWSQVVGQALPCLGFARMCHDHLGRLGSSWSGAGWGADAESWWRWWRVPVKASQKGGKNDTQDHEKDSLS